MHVFVGDTASMSVRESINKLGKSAGILIVLLSLVALFVSWRSTQQKLPDLVQYFTVDDGETWFAGDKRDPKRVPPFEYEGKTAVLAHVFRCDDGTEFVGYLERYTPEAKRIVEAARSGTAEAQGIDLKSPQAINTAQQGREVKRPKDAKWVSIDDMAAREIMSVKCPSGSMPVELGL